MEPTLPDDIQGTEPATDETTVVPGAAEPEAEPVETDPDAPGDETPEPEPDSKPPSGVDKRIRKLVWQAREAERREAYWRGQAEAKGGASTPQGAEPTAKDGPPKQEQFETYDQYIGAVAEHRITEKLAQERQRLVAEMEARELQGGFDKRVEAVREKHADFDDVAFTNDHEVSPTMRDAILNTPDGAEIAYYLGQNHEESNRIARLSPNHQILELGRISARLAAPQSAPPPRPASAAPAPITPVKAGGRAVEGLREDLPIGEWMKRRNGDLRKRA